MHNLKILSNFKILVACSTISSKLIAVNDGKTESKILGVIKKRKHVLSHVHEKAEIVKSRKKSCRNCADAKKILFLVFSENNFNTIVV